jgi:hypothetical protein
VANLHERLQSLSGRNQHGKNAHSDVDIFATHAMETKLPSKSKRKQRLRNELLDVVADFLHAVGAQPSSLTSAPA